MLLHMFYIDLQWSLMACVGEHHLFHLISRSSELGEPSAVGVMKDLDALQAMLSSRTP